MAKRACGKYLETVLRKNLGEMQRNVHDYVICNTIYKALDKMKLNFKKVILSCIK